MTDNDSDNDKIGITIIVTLFIVLFLIISYEFGKSTAIEKSYNLFSQVKTGSEIRSIDDVISNSELNCEYNEIISGTNSVVKELIVGPLKLYMWFENGILTKMENKKE